MIVNGAITYGDVAGFPAGSVVDHVSVVITGGVNGPVTQNVAPGTSSVSFDLDAGNYDFSVSAQDASNANLGSPVTGSFVVAAPQLVTLSLPASAQFAQA